MKGLALAWILLASSVLALAAQSAPPAAPPPSETKTAPTIAGKWAMVVDLEAPDASSTLEIKLDGKKVTGSIAGANTYPIVGEYADGKLTFSMDYNGQTTVNFSGLLKEDGTVSGTMDYGQGPITWRAKRAD